MKGENYMKAKVVGYNKFVSKAGKECLIAHLIYKNEKEKSLVGENVASCFVDSEMLDTLKQMKVNSLVGCEVEVFGYKDGDAWKQRITRILV